MSDEIPSGEFCRYTDHGLDDAVGMVLRTSTNEMGDGSTQDFVEVVGPLPVRLLPANQVRPFDEPQGPDPTAVTGSTSGDVGRKATAPGKLAPVEDVEDQDQDPDGEPTETKGV